MNREQLRVIPRTAFQTVEAKLNAPLGMIMAYKFKVFALETSAESKDKQVTV